MKTNVNKIMQNDENWHPNTIATKYSTQILILLYYMLGKRALFLCGLKVASLYYPLKNTVH